MKRLFNIIALLVFFCGTAHADHDLPSVEDTERIILSNINTGWRLTIRADGSAVLQYGSNPLDNAESPAGTFSLENTHKSLVPKLREKPTDGDIAVAIAALGATSVSARYINHSETKQIFAKAQQKSKALDNAHFEALIRDHPIESQVKNSSGR